MGERQAPFPIIMQDVDIESTGRWASCRYPDRPPDSLMSLHDCCPKCYEQIEIFISLISPAKRKRYSKMKQHLGRRLKLYGPAQGAT